MKIKPCPFCGERQTTLTNKHALYDVMYQVLCQICGAYGPIHDDENQAIKAWNKRAISVKDAKKVVFIKKFSRYPRLLNDLLRCGESREEK